MAQAEPPRGVVPGDLLLVVHDFDARGVDELTLRRGDKIELVELDDGFGDGWYLGKHLVNGTTGLFPGIYTTAAPKRSIRRVSEPDSSIASSADSTEDIGRRFIFHDDEDLDESNNAETTPQASRHVSASGMQAPSLEITASAQSPKQTKRSSSSPLPSTNSLAVGIQKTIRDSLRNPFSGEDSPVMNETLSVIDEHITDLSTTHHSVAGQELKPVNDSESDYSNYAGHRLSYINGNETDEEEESRPTEEQVRKWSHTQTANYLRNLGVDPNHCDIFEEQEITGEVLLEMDQEFLFMKEFDFGVMGRRLKTWHKVKAFQEEVKGFEQPRGSVSSYSGRDASPTSRAGHNGTYLPRVPSLSEKTSAYHQARGSTSAQPPRLSQRSNSGSPFTSQGGKEFSFRPSAASIRDINHTRRHSSIDTTGSPGHLKQPSFDRDWTMSMASSSRPGTSVGTTTEKSLPQAPHDPDTREFDSGISIAARFDELDRGYFSGGEVESRRGRKVLQKRGSTVDSIDHSRKSSYNEGSLRKSPLNKRHSHFGSAESIRDMSPHVSAAAKAYHGGSLKGRFRSSGSRFSDKHSQSSNTPVVTNLEEKSTTSSGLFSAFSPLSGGGKLDGDRSSPGFQQFKGVQQLKSVGPKFRRAVGLRAASDAEKGTDTPDVPPISPVKESNYSTARTGSTTPSATSKSSERHSTDGSGKTGDGGLYAPRPRPSTKGGIKSKKDTSAYVRGLEKKTPQEQMLDCDFSGWMKKKSSHLMTTWKPRLFVLRGRRLSYYYSDNDTEERGLIDITGHRVLRADSEPLTALHATLTGAKVSIPAASSSTTIDSATFDQASSFDITSRSKAGIDGPFIFKLVPPKMSRSVQFTKPAIHYFQVDSVKQGRLWMAALMKATIERDPNMPVTMTNKQKTISLKQALLMNKRPPTLLTEQEKEVANLSSKEQDKGLRIRGLSFDKSLISDNTDGDKPQFDTLDRIDTGPSSLFPESLAESTPSEQSSDVTS